MKSLTKRCPDCDASLPGIDGMCLGHAKATARDLLIALKEADRLDSFVLAPERAAEVRAKVRAAIEKAGSQS